MQFMMTTHQTSIYPTAQLCEDATSVDPLLSESQTRHLASTLRPSADEQTLGNALCLLWPAACRVPARDILSLSLSLTSFLRDFVVELWRMIDTLTNDVPQHCRLQDILTPANHGNHGDTYVRRLSHSYNSQHNSLRFSIFLESLPLFCAPMKCPAT